MTQEQAKNLIIQTFENSFDKNNFVRFISNLLKSFDKGEALTPRNGIQGVTQRFLNFISSWERIGRYRDENGKIIDILIVKLEKETSFYRARTAQRNFIADYLQGKVGTKSQKDAALVAFVAPDEEDWRFSLVKLEYRFTETPSGKIKVKEEFTPAKRWSFLVGKNEKSHTAQTRFKDLLVKDDYKPKLSDLEKAFDVEVVTKEFFKEYRNLFIISKTKLDEIVQSDPKIQAEFTNKNINTVDFTKKLLGQIVFLYFLQRKGWFGVEKGEPWGTGHKDFMRKLFNKEIRDYNNFFNDILEPLFYEALRNDRSHDDHFYQYFNCKIPFLNGGLFDPINNYDWVNTDIVIPNEIFSNDQKDGILDVFDLYNFTVNEEEPLEKEVALDPELLGKIYEKLNAIREDNFDEYVSVLNSGKKGDESKFNKEYGVYYTPREIVHYMCQESLINYLETELNGKVAREDIEQFVRFADSIIEAEEIATQKDAKIASGEQKDTSYKHYLSEHIIENATTIDKLLDEVKILDPAVGSGAFLVGMLHEIVKLRKLLSNYTGQKISTYDLKKHTIENSLYGVDIDAGAVEICKLRFWLSLVVDEEDFKDIKPLPNLDYKIVCGNSLLTFPQNWNSEIEERIANLEDQLFSETNAGKRKKIREELDKLIQKRLANSEKNFGYKINFDFRLFFPHPFRKKDGFDIVIANPPYVRQERIKHLKPSLQIHYDKFFNSTSDLYTYFYKKAYDILKKNGVLCFISSNKWMRAKYGENLRKLLKENTQIIEIIDFSGYRVFEQTVDTNIILFRKTYPPKDNKLKFVEIKSDEENVIDFILKNSKSIPQEKLSDNAWTLADDKVLALKEKIERIGKPLKDWNIKIYYGIKTGYNEAFIIDTETRSRILANCKDEEERKRTEEIFKPILRGRDIGKYFYKWAGLWLIKIEAGWTNKNRDNQEPESFFKKTFPSLYEHFISFSNNETRERRKGLFNRDDQGDYWWELRPCDYYSEFEKEKIVFNKTTKEDYAFA